MEFNLLVGRWFCVSSRWQSIWHVGHVGPIAQWPQGLAIFGCAILDLPERPSADRIYIERGHRQRHVAGIGSIVGRNGSTSIVPDVPGCALVFDGLPFAGGNTTQCHCGRSSEYTHQRHGKSPQQRIYRINHQTIKYSHSHTISLYHLH